MAYQIHFPPDSLKQYVYGFTNFTTEKEHYNQKIACIPSGAMMLNFEMGTPMRAGGIPAGDNFMLPRSSICGQITTPHYLLPTGPQTHFNVVFLPTGFHKLTNMKLGGLKNAFTDMDDVGPEWKALSQRVHDCTSMEERIAVLTKFLEGLLARHHPKPSLPDLVIAQMSDMEEFQVNTVAANLGFTARHIRRTFSQEVGIPPKVYHQIMRIHRVIRRMRKEPDLDLMSIVALFGFSDQAHLARQFQKYTGTSITRYLKTPPDLRDQWMIWE